MGLSSLFGPKLPIDGEELEFQLATFKWLLREFGAPAQDGLITATPAFFPSAGRRGVEVLFEEVRAAAGMADWPCDLREGDRDREVDAGNAHLIRHAAAPAPCGTFHIAEDLPGRPAVITYNPGLVNDTGAMIATFAHELGHYLMATAEGTPPGGWDLHELHTDLAAVYLGFGIFLANSARNFRQFHGAGEMGWSSGGQGYLSEGALVTALVIAERLAGRDATAAAPHLKTYLKGELKRAAKALARRHPDMAGAVAAIDLSQFAGD
ncbi:hypothetical protein RCO27_19090 [Sphingosinicella sp. LHD-64]|uniref:hypothetical protein n=1 Tax=Sphingosinicella sp. LHD-64 TaxID=3072139 RepID=UPI00280FC098|nr:hypothetical protein [Sphingosinicella sp. LHD-64]MDQ8758340.1 hypothetical protein [Sphingosinicella sp. LHD-64]